MAFKTLVFATDRDQLRAWRSAAGAHDAHAVVVTADLHVAAALEDSRQPFLEVWSYLEAADIDRAQRLRQQLAAEWWRPFLGEIEYKGVLLADAMSRDMWDAFAMAINAHTVINRILDAEKPERLVLFADLKKATFWDPADGPYPDVFNAVALWIARQRRLPVRRLSAKRRLSRRARSPASQNRHNSRLATPTSPVLPFDLLDDSAQGTIAILLGRVDYHKQRHLIKALYESPDYNCILLRRGRYEVPEISNQALDWTDYPIWFSAVPPFERELQEAWRRFKRQQAEYAGDFSYIFANFYLDFQFKAFWERVADAARIVDAAMLVCNGLQPDLCIFGLDASGPSVCWNRVAKLCGVTTLTIPHGVIGPASRYELLNSEADYLAVEGDYSRRALQALGRPPAAIKVVGFPGEVPSSSHRGHRSKSVLLMTCLSGYGLVGPLANLTKLRNDWQYLSELIERRQDLHFVIKPHPRYDHYHFYRNLCAKLPSNIELREGVSLSEVFPDASVAVMVNYPSTAALEAMLTGVPLVYLRSAIYKAPGLRSALDDGGVICVDCVEDLEAVLDELISNPARRAETLEKSQTLIAQFAPYAGEASLRRILDLIEQLTSRGKQQRVKSVPNRETDILLSIWAIREYLVSGDNRPLHEALTPIARRGALTERDKERLWELGVMWLETSPLAARSNACALHSVLADLLSLVPQELGPPRTFMNRLYGLLYWAEARRAYRAGKPGRAVGFAVQVPVRSPGLIGLVVRSTTQAFIRWLRR